MNKILKNKGEEKSIAIFGASGFIGRNLISFLSKKGWIILALMRNPQYANYLLPMGDVGQIHLKKCNILDYNSVLECTKNMDSVVNLVGILFENKKQTFNAIHSEGTKNIAKACLENNIENFIHISALGVNKGSALYSITKTKGEENIKSIYKKAVILRPSVVFGPFDNFVSKFYNMALFSPFLPLIGKGLTKFQPVSVIDLVNLIEFLAYSSRYKGKTFELGGPNVLSLKEIFDLIIKYTGTQNSYIPISFTMAKLLSFIFSFMPNPPITIDQVRLLQKDSMIAENKTGFEQFNIKPISLEAYMEFYKLKISNC